MIHVLFVDDEPGILEGLEDVMHTERARIKPTFAASGAAGLDAMRKNTFDVVVSDMRMPGMDGAEFLDRVRQQYPDCMRIILTGQADREAVMRALPVAHQILNKPCDDKILCATLHRVAGMRLLLTDVELRKIVGKLDRLPAIPATYLALSAAAARDNATLKDFADVIETDPATCVKILQYVNSGYFGSHQRIGSIRQAVTYLGVEVIRALVLGAHIFALATPDMPGFSILALQQHSLMAAQFAKRFVGRHKLAEDAFTAALLHDIGKLVLAAGIPEQYSAVCQTAESQGQPVDAVERQILGTTHAEVGAYLLSTWGLPLTIVEAVAFHHAPSQRSFAAIPGDSTGMADAVLAALHVADCLLEEAASQESNYTGALDLAFLKSANYADALPQWRQLASEIEDNRER